MNASSLGTDWLARAAGEDPDATALVENDGTSLSYGRLDDFATREAQRIRDSGFEPGQVTLVPIGEVGGPLVVMLWGAWRARVVPMLIDHDSPLLAEWVSTLRQLSRQAPMPVAESPLHTVVLTSGSSGVPRAVRLTHDNVAAAVASSARQLGNTGDDRWLLTLPLFHVGGLSILWRSAAAGGSVVIHRSFRPRRVAAAIRAGEVSMASFVPTMLYRLLAVDPGPYSGMRAVLLGGAAANRELVERGLDAGLPILQTYGMTEACSQVATVLPGEAVESLGTAGRPLPGITIATGEAGVGEIVIDGPMVSPGYLGEPDRRGGHHTGDIGYVDDNGRLVVLGRVDDMVVTGGENVYPGRVAEVLSGYRNVEQVEVVGVPDPEWGQALVAIVVGEDISRADLEAWARERLSRHEVPKRWAFRQELPLQAGGKVDRAALDEIARGAQ
ncbi:MAG: AMP-binding protein [Acidimicrobiia bacterium]|nr:AMP-binding protein [Acidimicrobiia bacterium]